MHEARQAVRVPSVEGAASDKASRELLRASPIVIRNSAILCCLALFGAAASLVTALYLAVMACLALVRALHAHLTADRLAACAVFVFGAWILAHATAVLWKLGWARAHCEVRLDGDGAHFKLNGKRNSKEIFMAWEEISAVHYKRIAGEPKATILGSGDRAVIVTPYSFSHPEKIANLVAAYAGQPMLSE